MIIILLSLCLSLSLSLFFSAATKVLIAPLVILLVMVLGAFALVIGNTIIHMNTHIDKKIRVKLQREQQTENS